MIKEPAMTLPLEDKPWFREPWLWFVLFPIITVVIVSSITVTIAFKTKDDHVVDDYYKEGRLIDRRFAAEQAALALGLYAVVDFDFVSGELVIQLSSTDSQELDKNEGLSLFISHPQNASRDAKLQLKNMGFGRYRSDLEQALFGLYYLRLSALSTSDEGATEHWRLSGDIYFGKQNTAQLTP